MIIALLGDKQVEVGTSPAVRVAANLLMDQGSHLTHLNIIRCMLVMVAVYTGVSWYTISGRVTWKQQLTEVKEEGVAEAMQWLYAMTPTSSHETASTLTETLKDAEVPTFYVSSKKLYWLYMCRERQCI